MMSEMAPLRFLLAILATAATASALDFTGASVSIDDKEYFVAPFIEATVDKKFISEPPTPFGFQPVSVIDSAAASPEAIFESWSASDDVFTTSFAATVLSSVPDTPPGPYFLSPTGTLHRAYRLYRDVAGAFSQSLLQSPDGRFGPLSAHVASSTSLTIGVPSRLYFNKTSDKPLAGVRVGVKDIFALAGTKTSNGNRAWYELYPASDSTAPSIRRLLAAGAVVVGLQVAAQFAQGEAATADWVDYHAPFNPRGDGYDQPGASTAGGGASLASYDWLDLAVGSDTGGSLRAPAAAQGLFGNRPSLGISELGGVMPLSPTMDTVGLIARDPEVWHAASGVLYGEGYGAGGGVEGSGASFPSKILTFKFPDTAGGEEGGGPADGVLLGFAERLAQFLGGNSSAVDLDALWDEDPPAAAAGQALDEYLNLTYAAITGKEQLALVRDPFYADYAGKHTPWSNTPPLGSQVQHFFSFFFCSSSSYPLLVLSVLRPHAMHANLTSSCKWRP